MFRLVVFLGGIVLMAAGAVTYTIGFFNFYNAWGDAETFATGIGIRLDPTSAWVALAILGVPMLIFLGIFLFSQFAGEIPYGGLSKAAKIFAVINGLIGVSIIVGAIATIVKGGVDYQGTDASQNPEMFRTYIISMVGLTIMGVGDIGCAIGTFASVETA